MVRLEALWVVGVRELRRCLRRLPKADTRHAAQCLPLPVSAYWTSAKVVLHAKAAYQQTAQFPPKNLPTNLHERRAGFGKPFPPFR